MKMLLTYLICIAILAYCMFLAASTIPSNTSWMTSFAIGFTCAGLIGLQLHVDKLEERIKAEKVNPGGVRQ